MEILASVLYWLFINTIYGLAAICAVIYLVLNALKKVIPKLPDPAYIVVPIFIIGLFTLPSLPRYKFEDDIMSKIEGKDWIRVVNITRLGSLTEPLTWFKPPAGSVTIVMPDSRVVGGFTELIMMYEEKEIISIVKPDCTNLTILYAQPDDKGVFRYITNSPVKMGDEEIKWYCEYDWSKEKEALRREELSQMSDTNKKK